MESLTTGPELENSQGQTRSCGDFRDWSALPPIATNERTSREVRVVPHAAM